MPPAASSTVRYILAAAYVVMLATAGCGPVPPSRAGTLQIGTSTIAAPAVKAWVDALSHPPKPLDASVSATGSTTALERLIEGQFDLIVTSRRMSANEFLAGQARGRKIEESLLGFGIYRVLVNPQNPVSSLTMEQVGDLFSRRVRDWSEVGGPKQPVVCVYRKTMPGHFDLFFEKEVSLSVGPGSDGQDTGFVVADDTAAIVAAIQSNPGGLGYLLSTDPAPGLKTLAIQSGLSKSPENPTIESALAGKYPMLRPLYMYIDASSPRSGRFFRQFALSDSGRKILAEAGFAPAPFLKGTRRELDPATMIPDW